MAVEVVIGSERVVIGAPGPIVTTDSAGVVVSSQDSPGGVVLGPSTPTVVSSTPAGPVTVIPEGETVQVGTSLTGGQVNILANAGTTSLVGIPDKIGSVLQLKGLLDSASVVMAIVGNDAQATAIGFAETSGPTDLTYGAVPDGFVLSRSGASIIGLDPAGFGTGDVVGPTGATDEAVARFDTTTGKLIQNSVVTISDLGLVSGLAIPVGDFDAATKGYVDGVVDGLKWKQPARAIETSSNITLSGLQTIDGVSLVANDRVLLTAQLTGSENGIWLVQAGAWTRPADFNTGDGAANAALFISEGTLNSDTRWVCTNDSGSDVIDTDALVFVEFGGLSEIIAGAGLTKTANTLDVVANVDGSITVNPNDIRVGILATDAQHGVRGGGTQHADATGAVDGFMSAADKTRHDAHMNPVSTANPHAVSLEQARTEDNAVTGPIDMSGNLINNVTNPAADQDAATRDYHDRNYLARSRRSYLESEFVDLGNFAEGVTAVVAGAGAQNGPALVDKTNHPGIWCLETGTTAAGRGFIIGSATRGYHVGGAGITRVGSIVQTGTNLSDAVNEYVDRAGFFNMALPNTILEGIGFEYQFDQNGGRWQGVCEDGLGETSVDLGITVTALTWYDLEFEVNAAGTSVQFFIDGAAVGTPITANIPSGTGFNLFYNFMIMKLVGTANRSFYIDHYYIYQEVTR